MTTRALSATEPNTVVAGPTAGQIAAAFHQALAVATTFAGSTAPNPPVGCTALDASGKVLAVAAHERAGAPHAEAAAIEACRRMGALARLHTLVVTLEPCNHHGRTPPCVDAILATRARVIWIGAADPNARVRGGGAARLGQAGLDVRFIEALPDPRASELGSACRRLIAPVAHWSHTGRPWLTLKQAFTADGGMVPLPGAKTFTSEASLGLAHRLRRRSDAIITGSGCVLADNPLFTVRRVADHPGKQRRLAILDRRGRVPAAYLRDTEARGLCPKIYADIDEMLDELGAAGVLEALVEAGPTLTATVLERGLWNERVVIRRSAMAGRPDTVDITHRDLV